MPGPVVLQPRRRWRSSEPAWLAAGVTVVHEASPPDVVEVRWAAQPRRPGRGDRSGYRPPVLRLPPAAPAWFEEDVTSSLAAEVVGLERFDPVQVLSELP